MTLKNLLLIYLLFLKNVRYYRDTHYEVVIMLLWMKLKNLALVDEAEIDFSPGYNVISGETGAGKSVIMGGLAMLLGARADKSAIRVGTDKCEITASFQLPSYAFERVVAVLTNAGIEMEGDTLLIRRVISSSSTKNYIKG